MYLFRVRRWHCVTPANRHFSLKTMYKCYVRFTIYNTIATSYFEMQTRNALRGRKFETLVVVHINFFIFGPIFSFGFRSIPCRRHHLLLLLFVNVNIVRRECVCVCFVCSLLPDFCCDGGFIRARLCFGAISSALSVCLNSFLILLKWLTSTLLCCHNGRDWTCILYCTCATDHRGKTNVGLLVVNWFLWVTNTHNSNFILVRGIFKSRDFPNSFSTYFSSVYSIIIIIIIHIRCGDTISMLSRTTNGYYSRMWVDMYGIRRPTISQCANY